MENKYDAPAFPMEKQVFMQGRLQIEIPPAPGLSKLEFLACNAPADIPGWFIHTPPDIDVTPRPLWYTIEPKADQDYVKAWLEDGQELPDRLEWFGEQYKKHEKEDALFRAANLEAKYFQWRRYYAEQLLKELEK
jgi:hypothetical protein